ncbi:glycosyl transferase family 2 [Thioclava sp. SK-1]|uniref:glycosyltransferase family 2 protein n=1 Tax=Thioclava sp. SK-1 TaxID=1889770 RepID=UPI0008254876|nr:glycosyltransferase family 2 protein [Thioclava sp. SK-1]OCX65407.1 glycosyl transferase family 2 [Thioclava sp. SK-1]
MRWSQALSNAGAAYRLRLKRRKLLWRAMRCKRDLHVDTDRSAELSAKDILLFATMRNELPRLPSFLAHYRALGVAHFLIVANDSDPDMLSFLRGQADVSLWTTQASYREARFGMDWLNHMLMRHGSGHWCVTVDADELLVYPDCDTRPLPQLTRWLDARNVPMMPAMMLDMYPDGPLSTAHTAAGQSPADSLPNFDGWGYSWEYQSRFHNISIRGGPRKRSFFADTPDLAPHLHKTPLIRWHWRYAYVSSMHIALPAVLNTGFDARRTTPTGVLLHSKFLDGAIERARHEKHRGEHFTHRDVYDSYYDRVAADPDLRYEGSCRYKGPNSLLEAGLMRRGDWH